MKKVKEKNIDEKIAETGKEIVKQLNSKYGNIFNFIYRKENGPAVKDALWAGREKEEF